MDLSLILIFIMLIRIVIKVGPKIIQYWDKKSFKKYLEAENIQFLEESSKFVLVHFEDIQNFQKYGSIWGTIENNKPSIFICDPEIVKSILVKDFEFFHSRDNRFVDNFILGEMMNSLQGEKWKQVRSLFSPTFSTSKIKNMSKQILECSQNLIKELKSNISEEGQIEINLKEMCSSFSLSVIAKCAFGIEINPLAGDENEFVKNVKRLSEDAARNNPQMFWKDFLSQSSTSADYFISSIKTIIKLRKEKQIILNDFLDHLSTLMFEDDKILKSDKFKTLNISEKTLIAQAILFIFAAHDTVLISLSMLLYNLASHPEKQKKLYEEINNKTTDDKNNIKSSSSYLRACINETLRLQSPLIRLRRRCQKDWNFKNYHIKKGTMIYIPIWPIHHNNKIYSNPNKFYPERFLEMEKEWKNSCNFLSFGIGPRSCLGLRFGIEELEISIINILQNFILELNEKSQLNFLPDMPFTLGFDPININFKLRN